MNTLLFRKKFIIEGNSMIISNCKRHTELVNDEEKVKGGGYLIFDYISHRFVITGCCPDFGKYCMVDVLNCIKNKNTFNNKEKSSKFIINNFVFDLLIKEIIV